MFRCTYDKLLNILRWKHVVQTEGMLGKLYFVY